MADFNLRQRLGIHMMTPSREHCEKVIRNLRYKQTVVNAQWNYFEHFEGETWDWGWFDGVMRDLAEFTDAPPMVNIAQFPAWVDTSLHPRGDPRDPWVPNLPVEKVSNWYAFVEAITGRYPQVRFWCLDKETNVDGQWKGTPQEYANQVILPAAEAIHRAGAKVVAPGTTIQKFESQAHYDKSRMHMKVIASMCAGKIDVHSFHSYAKSAERTVDQNYSFIKDCGLKGEIWCTETGFPEDHYWISEDWEQSIRMLGMSGQQRQLERFKTWLPVVETRGGIQKQFVYRGWDVKDEADKHGTNGLLTVKLKQKLAADYIKAELMEDKPPQKKE